MPFYDYECKVCSHEFTEQRTIAERHAVVCPRCKGIVSIVIGEVAFHKFIPHYNVKLGTYLSSRREKEAFLKERGLMSVGDAKVDEVQKVADENRKHRERERTKKRKKEFCETVWPKYAHKLRNKDA